MANTLLTQFQKLNLARSFQADVSANDNHYYFFVSNPDVNSNTDDLFDSTGITVISAYRNMIQGKLIANSDVYPVVRNIPWVSGTEFAMYDDQDEELFEEDFYTVVNAGSFYHVFKVLDNNNGAQSTIQPDISHISGANTILYQTADGYRWKYLYTVSQAVANDFSSTQYFPASSNSTVVESAVKGAIDIIKVESGGEGYNNYLANSFQSVDIRVGGNTRLYALSTTQASTTNGFYTGCLLYISSGSGVGEYRTISDYICNSTGNFLVTNTAFTSPMNGSQYQIFPGIQVLGDGEESSNVIARAMINADASNAVFRIEILDRGADYAYATATVIANSVVAVSNTASIRPIHSSRKGHGVDPAAELSFVGLGINVRLANSESNTILTEGAYQTIGIIRKPKFANVELSLSNVSSSFLVDEIIHAIEPFRIGIATINTTCTSITFSNSDIRCTFPANTLLYVSNGSSHELTRIASHPNSTLIVAVSNLSFACTSADIYLANSIAEMVNAENVDASTIRVSNTSGHWAASDYLIGNSTGTVAYVDAIDRNGVTKGFDTFVQLYKYRVTSVTGSWEENETVMSGNSTALFHSLVADGGDNYLYTSNQVGQFSLSSTLTGETSGATAVVANAWSPELVFASGDVVYMENLADDVSRAEEQSEVFKLFLRF